MIPGIQTKVSEEVIALTTTITSLADVSHVTDTTSTTVLATILAPLQAFSILKIVINRSGANMTTVTTGNIATAVTLGTNVAILFTWSKLTGKWYPGALA